MTTLPPRDPTPPLFGGAGSWPKMELLPWPFYLQTADSAMDGDGGSGPNALNNCGPETDAMILAHISGVVLDADYVWDMMQALRRQHGEPTGPGYTSVSDTVRFFRRIANIDTAVIAVDASQPYTDRSGAVSPAPNALLWHIWHSLTLGHPLSALCSFSAPNAEDGHFRAIWGMDPEHIWTADPATGAEKVESYASFWAWSKGVVTEVKRRRFT